MVLGKKLKTLIHIHDTKQQIINKMIIPNEIISKIIGYINNVVGYDYKYCRTRKQWLFSYNKYNKNAVILNNMLTNTWIVRRFYDMSLPENAVLINNPNFRHANFNSDNGKPLGILYYTTSSKNLIINNLIDKIRVNVYTTIEGNTFIGIYKNGHYLIDLFHKLVIKDKNKFEYTN